MTCQRALVCLCCLYVSGYMEMSDWSTAAIMCNKWSKMDIICSKSIVFFHNEACYDLYIESQQPAPSSKLRQRHMCILQMLFLLSGSNTLPTFFCKKAVVMHLHTRPDMCAFHAFKKLALISKTNENLKLLKPCYSNLHNNYNIAKKVGEDSKTNPCQLNKYNSAYCKNSCGFFLIESGLHILSRYLITTVVHKTS